MKKKSYKKILKTLSSGLCISSLLCGGHVTAAETSFDLGIAADASYNDNRFLSETNKQSVYLFRVSPVLDTIIEDEGSRTVISATGSFQKSSDEAIEEDRFTYGISLIGDYEFETATLNIGGGYDRQSIFDTEFDDTGAFLNNSTRDRGFAQIGVGARLSETLSVRLSDNFQVLDYSTFGLFNNYWSNSASLGVDLALNENTALIQNFGYLHYEPEFALSPSINSYSYRAGFRRQISENTSISVTGGVSYLNDNYMWSAVAEIAHELERNTVSFRAARELLPSGLGGLRQDESVALSVDYASSQRVTLGVSGSWRRSSEVSGIIQMRNEFVQASPWVTFQVLENLNLRFSYQLRRQRIGLNGGWGISNIFNVSVAY